MLTMPPMEFSSEALWLLPAFVLGFGLCPYLDLTFHRARRSTSPGDGRLAFAVGFGGVFLLMTAFSLLYAQWLAPAVVGQKIAPLAGLFLAVHLIAQSAFTVAAHARELSGRRTFGAAFPKIGMGVLVLIAGSVALGAFASKTSFAWRGHTLGEIVYWCFLGFYGFVFPTYVWGAGCGRGATVASNRIVGVVLACAVVAFPMYWMGFVERQPAWLLAGAAVVFASRLVVGRGAGSARA
jgi:hypothetical protein